jgi:hypothetical protein
VIATTPTTIPGVSILSRQKKRGNDVFELVLTREGIEVHRPERPAQLMSWDRVSEWEITEGRGGVILTLRGGGAVTPLVIPRWNVDDLDSVLSRLTAEPPPLTSERPVRPDSGALVWPEDAPLDGISSLSWPDKPAEAEAEAEAGAAEASDFALPDHPLSGFAEDTEHTDSDEPFRLPEPEQVLGTSESTASEIKRRADEEMARLAAALLKEEFRQES